MGRVVGRQWGGELRAILARQVPQELLTAAASLPGSAIPSPGNGHQDSQERGICQLMQSCRKATSSCL